MDVDLGLVNQAQCDQMAGLLFNIFTFSTMRICPKAYKLSLLWQILFEQFKNGQSFGSKCGAKMAKFGPIWSHCLSRTLFH